MVLGLGFVLLCSFVSTFPSSASCLSFPRFRGVFCDRGMQLVVESFGDLGFRGFGFRGLGCRV